MPRPRSVSDEAIFAAVAAVVTALGPAGLTLHAVAEHVGLSAPALTQRFGSKRGLLVAFASREAGGMGERFAAARSSHPEPLAALIAVLSSLPGPRTTREGVANNLAFLQLDLTDAELRTHAISQSRALRAEIAALLTEAIERGDLAPDTPATVADDLYAVYCGATLTWAIDGKGGLRRWLAAHVDRALDPYRATGSRR